MIDYYTTISIVLIAVGIFVLAIGYKSNSYFAMAIGLIPILSVCLYWAMRLIGIINTLASGFS